MLVGEQKRGSSLVWESARSLCLPVTAVLPRLILFLPFVPLSLAFGQRYLCWITCTGPPAGRKLNCPSGGAVNLVGLSAAPGSSPAVVLPRVPLLVGLILASVGYAGTRRWIGRER